MKQYDLTSSFFANDGIVLGDKIIINNIELTKVTSSNFYNSIRTQVENGIDLVEGKKYLCSAYCITFGKPKYFYSINKSITDGINDNINYSSVGCVSSVGFLASASSFLL